MAPEQLAGSEVTAQSDIYALGLVLYELFTGQRAIEAKNVADLVRKREAGIVPPSQIVRELDPAIDRAILRCLERDPADRPSRRSASPRRCRRRSAGRGAGGRRNAVTGDGGGGRREAARCRRFRP